MVFIATASDSALVSVMHLRDKLQARCSEERAESTMQMRFEVRSAAFASVGKIQLERNVLPHPCPFPKERVNFFQRWRRRTTW